MSDSYQIQQEYFAVGILNLNWGTPLDLRPKPLENLFKKISETNIPLITFWQFVKSELFLLFRLDSRSRLLHLHLYRSDESGLDLNYQYPSSTPRIPSYIAILFYSKTVMYSLASGHPRYYSILLFLGRKVGICFICHHETLLCRISSKLAQLFV